MGDEPLDQLITDMSTMVARVTSALENAPATVVGWRDAMEKLIARYSQAAMMTGFNSNTLQNKAQKWLAEHVATQLKFLDNFAVEIQNSPDWQAGWNSRAQMYANAIQTPYWKGKTKMLPLPAMPGEGGQCLSRCRCAWDISVIDEENGDYDCYWRLGVSKNNCQTCQVRAGDWSPLQIRGGVLL